MQLAKTAVYSSMTCSDSSHPSHDTPSAMKKWPDKRGGLS